MATDTQTYTLLKAHEHNGAILPEGAPISLTPEQWHVLHMHEVVGAEPIAEQPRYRT